MDKRPFDPHKSPLLALSMLGQALTGILSLVLVALAFEGGNEVGAGLCLIAAAIAFSALTFVILLLRHLMR